MTNRKPVPALVPVLALVSALFIGILIWAYFTAKRANPRMLDENGAVKTSQTLPLPVERVRA